ncbi:MAG: DUF3108 domain-containing protein [Alloprevotella sp.]|nr:DUF3108 domain-containing protein [Alloprevotella sp.]
MKRLIALCAVLFLLLRMASAQCSSHNEAFHAGEHLSYDLYFNWKFVWIKVGTAYWDVMQTRYNGQTAYQTTLTTQTSGRADKYFRMRDKLTSYVTTDLVPLYYQKDADEGGTFRQEKVTFSYPAGQCRIDMFYQRADKEPQKKSYTSKYCAFDMISMVLRSRSFHAESFKVGQRIPFLMAEGKHTEWRTLIYRGKKKFKMEGNNVVYRCLVFSYVEKEGNNEKEIVKFYITDDKNHLPVRLDLNLKFGTAKALLRSCRGVRNPQTAIIK